MNQRQTLIPEEPLLQQVSKTKLMEFTQKISKEVRLSGSEEELRAFHYVKQTLEEMGVETELLLHKAYISLPVKSLVTVGEHSIHSITHSMGQSVNHLQAELVYAATGTAQDYQDLQVVGKIVLLDGLATPIAVKIAEEQGAIGAVFINATHTHEMIVSTVWGTPTLENKGLLPSIPVVSVTIETGEVIKTYLEDGQNLCSISTEVETGIRTIPTLIAEIKGQVEPDKFVLFSGHIDSWHYGAMDNGTANAVMLEVARILTQQRTHLKRSLRLAFWSGHSHGRYAGSAWYCDTNWEDLRENCLLHLNVDSVGAKDSTVLTEANTMKETRRLANDVISQAIDQEFTGSRFGRSGDQSFWGTGTPSLFMGLSEQEPSQDPTAKAFSQLFGSGKSGGFGWWWHTTEDTIDKIDPELLVRDCKIYLSIVLRSLTSPIYPIDQLEAILDIEQSVLHWREKAGNRFDLSSTLERIEKVKTSLVYLQDVMGNVTEDAKLAFLNRCLMELSRYLVPLNYVKGSNFEHDLALKQPAVPKFSDIDLLMKTTPEQQEYYFLLTSLQRKRNEVNYALKQADRLVQETLRLLTP
ncbi:M28 family metallopeptidase [Brevibacillus choshinensis]|uniref:M28 family metallopeptidase n=1 Tax=Brevibacillus choshinensis TaxID=54911 RepID=UPI002E22EF0C|nr:M28 family peptidase [Brevibacillus choshinensis]